MPTIHELKRVVKTSKRKHDIVVQHLEYGNERRIIKTTTWNDEPMTVYFRENFGLIATINRHGTCCRCNDSASVMRFYVADWNKSPGYCFVCLWSSFPYFGKPHHYFDVYHGTCNYCGKKALVMDINHGWTENDCACLDCIREGFNHTGKR